MPSSTHGKVFKDLKVFESPVVFLEHKEDGSVDFDKTRAILTVGIKRKNYRDMYSLVIRGKQLILLVTNTIYRNQIISEICGTIDDTKAMTSMPSINVITIDGHPLSNVCSNCDYDRGEILDSCIDCLDEEYNELLDAMPGDQELIQARIQHMSERQTERGGHKHV